MAEEKRTISLIPKADALRKAGFSPAMTVVLVIVSMPGFWTFFFNKTGDEAKRKAEVAYEVLTNEVKHLREDDKALRRELDGLRRVILMRGGASHHWIGSSRDTVDDMSDLAGYPAEEEEVYGEEGASEEPEDETRPMTKDENRKGSTGRPGGSGDRIKLISPDSQATVTVPSDILSPEPSVNRAALPSLEDAMEQKIK